MVAWAVTNMGGEIPKQDPRLLADNMAANAWNVDLVSGPLDGLPYPELIKDLSGVPGYNSATTKRAYRVPPPPGTAGADAWLCLPSQYACVVPSPLTNDTLHRIYWTVPGDRAYWSTYASILAGATPFELGFYSPYLGTGNIGTGAIKLGITVTGGTATVVTRSYLYTFVDANGLESSPSLPTTQSGPSDGVWTMSNLNAIWTHTMTAAPGRVFTPVKFIRVYRTVTSNTAGAAYYPTTDVYPDLTFSIQPGHAYTVTQTISDATTDISPDAWIVGFSPLASAAWAPPPLGLDGLLQMPGGYMVGFTGNTLHFSEPYRPHAWPASYDLSLQYEIVALALWNQTLVVLTRGYPSTGQGTSPSSFTLSQVQVAEPCIDRGSVVTDLLGVYYGSQNGLVMLNYFGMQNQTLQTVDKKDWLIEFGMGGGVMACRHRAQYLGWKGAGKDGFIIDYSDQRLGVVWTDMLRTATAVWNDIYDGDTCFLAAGKVYRWDSQNTGAMPYRWRSKLFNLTQSVNLAACEITVDASLTDPAPTPPPGLSPITVVPNGANCQFRLWAEGRLIYDEPVTAQPQATFRLPSGFKAHEWQFEIVANVPVSKVKLATSMVELNGV